MQKRNVASRNAYARTSTDALNVSPASTPPLSDLNDRKAAQVNAALIHAAVNLLQDQQNLKEQYSTRCNAGYTPVVTKTDDGTPAVANNNVEDAPAAANSIECTHSVATRAWHYTAMSAATFTLSALLAYIATEAICKRVRGRN